MAKICDRNRSSAPARVIFAGQSFSSISPLLCDEILIAVLYSVMGYVLFRWFEYQAKKRGTLEAI